MKLHIEKRKLVFITKGKRFPQYDCIGIDGIPFNFYQCFIFEIGFDKKPLLKYLKRFDGDRWMYFSIHLLYLRIFLRRYEYWLAEGIKKL